MNVKRPITATITIGDQPSETDLENLKAEGYRGVVNLQNDGEPEQPLSTTAEGEKARALGLGYLHYGVSSSPLTEAGVNSVIDFIERESNSGKVLVHCRRGSRAAALVLLHQAKVHSWSPDEVFSKGKELGLDVEGGLRTLVENYLKELPSGS